MNSSDMEKNREIAKQLKIGDFSRHIFLCVGETCCSKEAGEASWKVLKDELKNRNLSLATGPSACYRTKAGCLRVCNAGPIVVVYPEGTWYGGMTADRIPRLIDEHIEGGKPIEEWIFARNPLPQ